MTKCNKKPMTLVEARAVLRAKGLCIRYIGPKNPKTAPKFTEFYEVAWHGEHYESSAVFRSLNLRRIVQTVTSDLRAAAK